MVLLAAVCLLPVDLSAAILNKFSNGKLEPSAEFLTGDDFSDGLAAWRKKMVRMGG